MDRWGVVVFEDRGINPSWNGLVNGEPSLNDAYIWLYTARLKCGFEEFKQTGHVIVVR
jgi:hypothetical protein